MCTLLDKKKLNLFIYFVLTYFQVIYLLLVQIQKSIKQQTALQINKRLLTMSFKMNHLFIEVFGQSYWCQSWEMICIRK